MPEPNAPDQSAANAPAASSATPTAAPDPEVARLRNELQDLKSREGRFRNEKVVMQARIRELEQLALSNGTEQPEYGTPSATGGYQPQYQYQPAYSAPAPQTSNFVSREEFDLWRVER